MVSQLDVFETNIGCTEALHMSYLYFRTNNVGAIDISELLRAEWVLVVGAMDCYIHDIVCQKMHLLIASSTNSAEVLPKALSNYKMPLSSLKELYDAENQDEKEALLMKYLRQTLHEYSFESVQSIDSAMSYIGVQHIWTSIAERLQSTAENIKKELGIIVRRRNVIAHQSDIVDFTKLEKQEIQPEDVEHAKGFIVKFVQAMNDEILSQTINA